MVAIFAASRTRLSILEDLAYDNNHRRYRRKENTAAP